ncbi:MAG TPA: PaaI family thioesterase [Cyclobacteriaceae bacterium]|nr:PaaI family thioesterase [Cyclobacteriaceae bacterium]
MDLSNLHQVLHWPKEGKIKELEQLFNDSPQMKSVAAQVDLTNLNSPAVLIPEVQPLHQGGIGTTAVNGGIISMLVDLAIGLLGVNYYHEGPTATQHLSIHFVKPLIATSVRLEAKETDVLGNRVFGRVRVMNEKGEICAFANGVLAKGLKKPE